MGTIKDIYEADLLIRNSGYSFSETTVGSMTLVEFKDGGSAVVASSQNLVVDDAYKIIREDFVGTSAEFPLLGNGVWVTQDRASLQTTDGTVTVIDSVTLEDDTVCIVRAHVVAIEDDATDRGSYIYTITVYRNGGDATLEGSRTIGHEGFSDSNWKVEFAVSGNDLQVTVQGVVAETINWEATLEYMIR